jgi:hypothetical protein
MNIVYKGNLYACVNIMTEVKEGRIPLVILCFIPQNRTRNILNMNHEASSDFIFVLYSGLWLFLSSFYNAISNTWFIHR